MPTNEVLATRARSVMRSTSTWSGLAPLTRARLAYFRFGGITDVGRACWRPGHVANDPFADTVQCAEMSPQRTSLELHRRDSSSPSWAESCALFLTPARSSGPDE